MAPASHRPAPSTQPPYQPIRVRCAPSSGARFAPSCPARALAGHRRSRRRLKRSIADVGGRLQAASALFSAGGLHGTVWRYVALRGPNRYCMYGRVTYGHGPRAPQSHAAPSRAPPVPPRPFRRMAGPSRPSQTPSRAPLSLPVPAWASLAPLGGLRAHVARHMPALHGTQCARDVTAWALHVHMACRLNGTAGARCGTAWELHVARWGPGPFRDWHGDCTPGGDAGFVPTIR